MSDEYRKVLASARWKKLRLIAIENAGYRCERCGMIETVGRLEVHHKHYRTLGEETLQDIRVLCANCHAKHDG